MSLGNVTTASAAPTPSTETETTPVIYYTEPLQYHERESRLPQWAQLLIGQLRAKARSERASAEEARAATNPDETDTIYGVYSERGQLGLPMSETIRFIVGPDREHHWIDVHVDRSDGNCVEIAAAEALWIAPRSGNTARVGATTWTHIMKGLRS